MVITKKYFTDFEEPALRLSVNKSSGAGHIKFSFMVNDDIESELELTTEDVKELINELESLVYGGRK
jgi:hypothetical protein